VRITQRAAALRTCLAAGTFFESLWPARFRGKRGKAERAAEQLRPEELAASVQASSAVAERASRRSASAFEAGTTYNDDVVGPHQRGIGRGDAEATDQETLAASGHKTRETLTVYSKATAFPRAYARLIHGGSLNRPVW
jgi:hypothetical protein